MWGTDSPAMHAGRGHNGMIQVSHHITSTLFGNRIACGPRLAPGAESCASNHLGSPPKSLLTGQRRGGVLAEYGQRRGSGVRASVGIDAAWDFSDRGPFCGAAGCRSSACSLAIRLRRLARPTLRVLFNGESLLPTSALASARVSLQHVTGLTYVWRSQLYHPTCNASTVRFFAAIECMV